jgi:hypothetical protein
MMVPAGWAGLGRQVGGIGVTRVAAGDQNCDRVEVWQ